MGFENRQEGEGWVSRWVEMHACTCQGVSGHEVNEGRVV